MYCNQCGHDIKDSANFCKKCGAPVDQTDGELTEKKRRMIKFFYTYRKRIALIFVGALLLCGVVIGAVAVMQGSGQDRETEKTAVVSGKKVSSVDLKDAYEIEDGRLVLDPLHVTYSDGAVRELPDYQVYIDSVKSKITENAIDAANLYDGKHLFRLEWEEDGTQYEYEKSVDTEHKKDTWEKYVDLVGMTGKEITEAYGSMSDPEFGSFRDGDWGYAYADINALSLRAGFAAGIFNKRENYDLSQAQCVEMSGTLNTLFYNLEDEMSRKELAELLGIALTERDGGGCTGTLSDGHIIHIDAAQAGKDIYTPDSTVRVTVSEKSKTKFFERLF